MNGPAAPSSNSHDSNEYIDTNYLKIHICQSINDYWYCHQSKNARIQQLVGYLLGIFDLKNLVWCFFLTHAAQIIKGRRKRLN